MAVDKDFILKNGIIINGDAKVSGNVDLSSTSSLIFGSTGPVINTTAILNSNTVLSQANASTSGAGDPIVNTMALFLNTVVHVPSSISGNFVVMLDWHVQISFPAAATARGISAQIEDNFSNVFGYRNSLLQSPSTVTDNGIGGTSISPVYNGISVVIFSVFLSIDATLANVLMESPSAYLTGIVLTSS